MAEEVHVHQEPPAAGGGGGGAGWIVALLVVFVAAIVIWFVFVRGGADDAGLPDEINVEIDAPGTGG